MTAHTQLHRLTPAKLKHGLEAHRRYSDGGGLWLQVSKSGTRSWLFQYTLGGRSRWHGLGPYPDVTMKEARERAVNLRKLVREGVDPIDQRKIEALKTASFKEVAKEYIDGQAPGWRNEKHRNQWTNTLTAEVYPVIGDLPVGSIDKALVLKVLRPIWNVKPETADRVRARIEKILDYAKSSGARSGENPAKWRGNLEHNFPKRSKLARVKHHAALPYADIPAFMGELRDRAVVSKSRFPRPRSQAQTAGLGRDSRAPGPAMALTGHVGLDRGTQRPSRSRVPPHRSGSALENFTGSPENASYPSPSGLGQRHKSGSEGPSNARAGHHRRFSPAAAPG